MTNTDASRPSEPDRWARRRAEPRTVATATTRFETAERDYIDRFYSLLKTWWAETAASSSIAVKVAHPSFRSIVEMGPLVAPLILDEVSIRPSYLVAALAEIYGYEDDPVPPSAAGKVNEIVDAWLLWAERRPLGDRSERTPLDDDR